MVIYGEFINMLPSHVSTNPPLVSILMPIHNGEHYLAAAVEGLQAQTYAHWELICVDDASTDGTPTLLAKLAASEARLRLFRHERNLGPGGTLHQALKMAQGEFAAIHDCDDISVPDRLERSLRAFTAQPELAVVGSGALLIDAAGCPLWERHCGLSRASLSWILARQSVPLVHSSTMLRMAPLRAIGGHDPFFTASCDYDLFLRMAQAGNHFGHVAEPLVWHRIHDQQLSCHRRYDQVVYSALAWERAQAQARGQKNFDLTAGLALLGADTSLHRRASERVVDYYCIKGFLFLGAGQHKLARDGFMAALRTRPSSLLARTGLALCLLPRPLVLSCLRAGQAVRSHLRKGPEGRPGGLHAL